MVQLLKSAGEIPPILLMILHTLCFCFPETVAIILESSDDVGEIGILSTPVFDIDFRVGVNRHPWGAPINTN